VAVDRHRVERHVREERRGARRLERILRSLSFHLSAAQLGITATSIVLGFIAEPTVARLLAPVLEPLVGEANADGVALVIALVLVTNLSIARPERMAYLLAPTAYGYATVFGPIVRFLNGSANWTVRRLGIEPKEELTSVRSLDELELLIRSSGEEGTLDPEAFTTSSAWSM
jgi:CBS domain containing-hemolysin-like protein